MSKERATWIFQANPNLYDIHQCLNLESRDLWSCVQYRTKIAKGDRALIWISGKQAGIYAIGTIMTDPAFQVDSEIGMKYWTNPDMGQRPRPRAWVKYEKVLIDNPLLKSYLQWDPELWDLSIFANARGTNFPVSNEEWEAIAKWL